MRLIPGGVYDQMIQIQILKREYAGQYAYIREKEGIFHTVFTMSGQMDVLLAGELREVFPLTGQKHSEQGQGNVDDQAYHEGYAQQNHDDHHEVQRVE